MSTSSTNTTNNQAFIGSSNIDTYEQTINNIEQMNLALSDIDSKNSAIKNKQQRQLEQLREIEDKEKLILTRSRMLQISQDRNSYKKKVIYSLIALILFIFIGTIMTYVLFIRKAGMVKNNGK
jgi:hypothetical protein